MSKKFGNLVLLLAFGAACFTFGYQWKQVDMAEQYTIGITYDAEVTAYCPNFCCCGEWADGITASGSKAEGFFVAAPPSFPFGTLIQIPGYNQGYPVPVLDRGGAIKGNKLDVFFPTHQEALNWGRQYLKVRVLEKIKCG